MKAIEKLSRRRVLRGVLAGSALTVGLPILDCFLNSNGTARAEGAPLPVRFGTWFWGLGLNPGRWAPKDAGPFTELGPELAPLGSVKDKINVISGTQIYLDGRSLQVHFTGIIGQVTGAAPAGRAIAQPTIDTLIADSIGKASRFRSLQATCDGNARTCYSYLAGGMQQAAEPSPAALYARIFGSGFVDPNNADFKPDPFVMAERSVLSATTEQRVALMRDVGAQDRSRLDEYFTSLRDLEQQIQLQLQKPAPLAACTKPESIQDVPVGTEVEETLVVNKLMMRLLAHALACDQTRVFNLAFSEATARTRFRGDSSTHHVYSHEEAVDTQLGYQPTVAKFVMKSMEGLAAAIEILDSFKEGDATLLDRTLLYACSDTSLAKVHSVVGLPIITAGKAGGAVRTGLHIDGHGDPFSRVGLTLMQALKLPVNRWGSDSMQTSKTITEVLA